MNKAYLSVKELSELTGKSVRQARRYANDSAISGHPVTVRTTRGNGGDLFEFAQESLPLDLQKKYAEQHIVDLRPKFDDAMQDLMEQQVAKKAPTREELLAKWDDASLNARERAEQRVLILDELDQLRSSGMPKMEALDLVIRKFETSQGSIYNWQRAVKGLPRSCWFPALLDDLKGQPNTGRKPIAKALLRAMADLYLTQTRMTKASVVRTIKRELHKYPFEWPQVDRTTLWNRFAETYPKEVQFYHREGEKKWEETYWTNIKRDRSMLGACQLLVGDGHLADYFVVNAKGKRYRPMLSAWQDGGSNFLFDPIVGEVENTDNIRRGFVNICKQYGVPDYVSVDNGMGYASKELSGQDTNRRRFKNVEAEAKGIFGLLGIRTIWAQVAHGQSKPIERAFGTLEDYLKEFPELKKAYLGNCPDRRPTSDRVPVSLEVFEHCVMEAVRRYNAEEGRRSEGIQANGRSYEEIFTAKLKEKAPRKLEAWETQYCLHSGVIKKVPDRNGGRFVLNKITYEHEALAEWMGEEIQIRYNADDMREARAYTLDGKFICQLEVTEVRGYLDRESASTEERAKRRRRKALREYQKTSADLVELETNYDRAPKQRPQPIVEEIQEDAPSVEPLTLNPSGRNQSEETESDLHRFFATHRADDLEAMKKPKVSLSLSGGDYE